MYTADFLRHNFIHKTGNQRFFCAFFSFSSTLKPDDSRANQNQISLLTSLPLRLFITPPFFHQSFILLRSVLEPIITCSSIPSAGGGGGGGGGGGREVFLGINIPGLSAGNYFIPLFCCFSAPLLFSVSL